MPSPYLLLFLAIAAEVAATSALPATRGFTRVLPSLAVIAGYAVSFYLLAQTVQSLQVGIVYAIWAGLGIVGVAAVGIVAYGQRLDLPALIGMAMIVGGVLIINLLSDSARH